MAKLRISMKYVWVLVFLPLVLGIFILFSSSIVDQANALTCKPPAPSLEESFQDSGVVFLGEAISKEYFPPQISDFEDSIVKFKLIESFKGFSNETMTVRTSEWFYQPSYEVGNDYVIFAFGHTGKAWYHKACTTQVMMPEEEILEQLRFLSIKEKTIPSLGSSASGMCGPLVYEELVEKAGAIFTGTVVSKEPLSEYINNVQFEIEELLLGDYKNSINVTTSEARMVSSEPFGGDPFEVGEKYFVIATNTLYADSSGCTYSLVIPILSGYHGIESSQNCSAKVHSQCLERCRIDEFRWGGDFDCLQTCYAENANECQLKPLIQTATPIPVDPVKLHADYVDSIISLQKKPAPLEQIYRGIRAPAVICNNDFVVVLKWTSYRSACVSPQTAEKLVERNWGLPAKNLSMNFSTDPYEIYTGTIAHIYFDYDGECKYYDTKLIKKLRENILEQHEELGWPREHIWENMWITNPGDQCRFVVDGFLSEDTLRRTLETIEGISNFRDYQRPYN